MWGKTCNRASGTLSSESTSQILDVLEGGVSYFSTQYAIRNTIVLDEELNRPYQCLYRNDACVLEKAYT